MFEEFAGKGSRVKYLNKNGRDFERARANEVLREGQELIVEDIAIYSWHSEYTFAGCDLYFSTVMFEVIEQKPVLVEDWSVSKNNRLVGWMGGQSITTSEIVEMDEETGICKTKNSTYHLGKPSD
jgi:hypothetical protein